MFSNVECFVKSWMDCQILLNVPILNLSEYTVHYMLLGEGKIGYKEIMIPFSLSCHIIVSGNYCSRTGGESRVRSPEASRRGKKQTIKQTQLERSKQNLLPSSAVWFLKASQDMTAPMASKLDGSFL